MSYSVTATLVAQKNRVQGSFPIYLYAIDVGNTGTTLYYTSTNYTIAFFRPGTSTPESYYPAPIKHDIIESNTKGEIGQVQLTVQNVNRIIIQLLLANEALRGSKVTIMLVFADSLTDSNSCIRDEYYIDSASVGEKDAVFVLTTKFIVRKVTIPSRLYRRDQCQWSFKELECGFINNYTRDNYFPFAVTATCLRINYPSSEYRVPATLKYLPGTHPCISYFTDNSRSVVATDILTIVGFRSFSSATTLDIIISDTVSTSLLLDGIYYSGTIASTCCNKTQADCELLGNVYRHGGFPSIPSKNVYY